MSRQWIRVAPEKGDTVAAAVVSGAIAAGVGLVAFYVLRTLLARESVGPDLERAAIPSRGAHGDDPGE